MLLLNELICIHRLFPLNEFLMNYGGESIPIYFCKTLQDF